MDLFSKIEELMAKIKQAKQENLEQDVIRSMEDDLYDLFCEYLDSDERKQKHRSLDMILRNQIHIRPI